MSDLQRVEAERDLWQARYLRIMGWVTWFRDSVCKWNARPASRFDWQGLNRTVGTDDLFLASYEIEAEVAGDDIEAARLAASKDEQFRALALEAAEGTMASGKSGREP